MCQQIEKERLHQKTEKVDKGGWTEKYEDDEVLFEFGQWKLSVAECFVLLWLDERGRLAERQSNGFLRTLAVGASIVDLVLLGFVDLDWVCPTSFSDQLQLRKLSVTDKGRTEKLPAYVAWLQPLLTHILESSPDATLESVAYEYQCYTHIWSMLNDEGRDLRPHSNAPTDPITDSLITKGILRKERAWNGVRFPEEDPACKAALVSHLRQVVMADAKTLPPVASMALLAMAHRGGEEAGLMHGPFLGSSFPWLNPWAQIGGSVFAPHEMRAAQKQMDALLTLGCGGAKVRPVWVRNAMNPQNQREWQQIQRGQSVTTGRWMQ